MLEFLAACVRGRMNIVISGRTSSGKTTLLDPQISGQALSSSVATSAQVRDHDGTQPCTLRRSQIR
jgi:pilus assembly protein CpaF